MLRYFQRAKQELILHFYDLLTHPSLSLPSPLQDNQIVTGVLGYAYRGYNKVLLALHKVEPQHEGTYVCEASNTAGTHSAAIRVIVGKGNCQVTRGTGQGN